MSSVSRALFKIREFFAEKIEFAQYPKQVLMPRQPAPPLFKHQMPFWKRYLLILFALIVIPLGLLLLFFVGLAIWAAFTA